MQGAAASASPPPLTLASASPRRAQLLREAGYAFTVVPAPHHEPELTGSGLPPAKQAQAASYFKARSTSEVVGTGLVLGADTVATLRGRVFGKPRDAAHAHSILTALSGTAHEVITGVTLLSLDGHDRWIACAVSQVFMRRLTDSQLETYLRSRAWEGKAGAYGLQDKDDPFVNRISGSYSNILGLPLELVARMLSAMA